MTPRALIEALHRESPYQYALALAGGGTGAAAALLNVPGGSRTLLEVSIPYNQQALTEYLGRAPEQFCSSATSLTLARRALERARWLAPGQPVAGVGCTASLATDRPKKGDHRFHIALVWSGSGGGTVSLGLRKGERNRDQEEALLDAVLLNGMAEAFGIAGRLDLALLPGEHLDIVACQASPLELMLAGDPTAPAAIHVEPDGQHALRAPLPLAVLPGAFNPTHHAHWGLAEVAARQLALPVAFEMSVHNVDKGTLPAEEVRRRLGQFIWRAPVWVTRAATFVEKASLFPGVAFVVGADTAARILAPRYYKEGDAGVTTALQFLRRQGCRFLVACRVDGPGNCLALADLPIPVEARDLFTAIPAETFRIDVSSTQLRERSS
ncbi:MAG TPA: hypothetical protein VEL76_07145 [Gemmataceae bacterium]|nr:hypothetical protein [Gemmataceae bacterium]